MTTNELMVLADACARHDMEPLRSKARAALSDALESVVRDAELWRAYKSRKDAVIAAGMGRNPLRQEVKPDTYAVINADGEVDPLRLSARVQRVK